MSASLVVRLPETLVRVTAPDGLLADLEAVLADLLTPGEPEREVVVTDQGAELELRDGDRLIMRQIRPDLAAATVVWHLNAIVTEAVDHVLVHAGCVAGAFEGAVLLPGRSGAGKSTLTAACVGEGLHYLSDELAGLHLDHGVVSPYARPIGLDHEHLIVASGLGRVLQRPAAPAAVVFPRYEPGATLRAVPLDAGWALVALAAHSPNLAALGPRGLAALGGLALACPAVQVTYGDAAEAVSVVRDLAARRGSRITAPPVIDSLIPGLTAIALGEELGVLHGASGRVSLLNPAAAAIWQHVAGSGSSSTEIESLIRGDDGPALSRSVIEATIGRLRHDGLLPPANPATVATTTTGDPAGPPLQEP